MRMYNKVESKYFLMHKGDILFETFMINKDFYEAINNCITSTSFMFNVYKYDSEDISSSCDAYIKHYLDQKHQDVFLAESEKDGIKEFRILNNKYYLLVLNEKDDLIETVKFSSKDDNQKSTTWNVDNDYFKDSKYFPLRYITNIYNFEEIKDIWSNWVKENFKDIIEGKIGGTANLLF